MVIVVIVPVGEKLKSTLQDVSQALHAAKKRFRKSVPMEDIAVCGPRKGMADGQLVSLQYRLSDESGARLSKIWLRIPDLVIRQKEGMS